MISRDTSTESSGSFITSSPFAWSHTCTGSDLILVVCAWVNSSDTVSGITYNGVSLTEQAAQTTSNGLTASIWTLANPATGSNNVEITVSGSGWSCWAEAISYTDGNTSNPVTDTGEYLFSTSPYDCDLTVTNDDSYLVGFCAANRNTIAVSGDGTEINDSPNNSAIVFDSNGVVSSGTKTATLSQSNPASTAVVLIALNPNTGGGGGGEDPSNSALAITGF